MAELFIFLCRRIYFFFFFAVFFFAAFFFFAAIGTPPFVCVCDTKDLQMITDSV